MGELNVDYTRQEVSTGFLALAFALNAQVGFAPANLIFSGIGGETATRDGVEKGTSSLEFN